MECLFNSRYVSVICLGACLLVIKFVPSTALRSLSNQKDVDDDLKRSRRQITSVNVCPNGLWQCRDGTCISEYDVCDGIPNCPDGSDETHALCRNMRCPSNLFRCTYGACAPRHAACDGVQHCADGSDELIPRCRSTSDEIDGQFVCTNGELIPAYKRCDGVADCSDRSDESVRACGSMICRSNLFQCAYGACVDSGADCDGKVDCADGSDEAPELCGGPPPVVEVTPKPNINQGGQCSLPAYPEHGTYRVVGNSHLGPGQVSSNPIIEMSCEPGYALDASSSLYCEDGLWSGPMPKCLRQCTMEPDASVSYECYGAGGALGGAWPCKKYEASGTNALPRCRDHFRPPRTLRRAKCVDGRWEDLDSCVPECGTIITEVEQLMIGGRGARRGELAWHAGIYRGPTREQICGGSLIRQRVVVSAAHCFWDKRAGTKFPPANYAVAVGKIHRSWSDRRDAESQKRNVVDVDIPKLFRGPENNFQEDLALVFVDRPFEYTAYIRPVCLDFDVQFDQEQLRPGNKGKVAGWGLTGPNGQASELLRVVELPVVEPGECLDRAPPDFKAAITVDKICAGFYNGTALCKGDSGGGLAFPGQERGITRYYLRGIVSTAPRNQDSCNAYTVTTFTKVTAHAFFFNTRLTGDV